MDDITQAQRWFPELQRWTADEVWLTVQSLRAQTHATPADLLRPEWEALRNPTPATGQDDFDAERVDPPNGFENAIAAVVIAHRLREVRAVHGFTRIDPPDEINPGNDPHVAPLSRARLDWLPAVEVRGEGLFVELREDLVHNWESRDSVRELADFAERAYSRWRQDRQLPPASWPGVRYLLLHSLSHILVRQLGLDCGYSSGSIRERIYASQEPPMAGALIFTASADSEGSLGGLAALGEPGSLGRLLRSALLEARYCAADPLCGDTRPGEKGTLNGAACHACMLASETTCERNNRLLDRSVLVETVLGSGCAYFTL